MNNEWYDGIHWCQNKKGYWRNNKYGLQHIYIWQQAHQATIDTPDDVIHHLDENSSNNAIENLQLMTREDHTRLHSTGKKHSEGTKRKMSTSATGNKYNLGHKASEETRQKISAAHMGNKYWVGKHHSEETKQKMSTSGKGRAMSNESKEKNRIAHLGKITSDETKSKLSKIFKGRKVSEETRAKMSEARKRYLNREQEDD